MLKKHGIDVKLEMSKRLPGLVLIAEEDVKIISALNNPFFKDFNFLNLSKKFKGVRQNEDLKKIFKPKTIKTGIQALLNKNQYVIFIPEKKFSNNERLLNIDNIYGPTDMIEPVFVNLGLKDVQINKGDQLGVIIIQSVNSDGK